MLYNRQFYETPGGSPIFTGRFHLASPPLQMPRRAIMVTKQAQLRQLRERANDMREQINANERRAADLKSQLRVMELDLHNLEIQSDPLRNYLPSNGTIVSVMKTFGVPGQTYFYVAIYWGGSWYCSGNGQTRMTHQRFIDWARQGDPDVRFYLLEPSDVTLADLAGVE